MNTLHGTSVPALPAGVVTPLVTFLDERGEPDAEATHALVAAQRASGVDGLLAVGSTGELGNLTAAQRRRAIEQVIQAAEGAVPVWAGIAGLGTQEAVEASIEAAEAGADALLVLPPLFFDVSDSELFAHFSAVAAASELPVVVYDVPARAPRKIPAGLLGELARAGVIDGVKDSSGDLTAARLLLESVRDLPGFATYLGVEVMIDLAVRAGFHGVVPGFANVLPAAAVAVHRAGQEADGAQRDLIALHRVLAIELPGAGGAAAAINALKVAAALVLGRPVSPVTAPFTPATEEFVGEVRRVLRDIEARG